MLVCLSITHRNLMGCEICKCHACRCVIVFACVLTCLVCMQVYRACDMCMIMAKKHKIFCICIHVYVSLQAGRRRGLRDDQYQHRNAMPSISYILPVERCSEHAHPLQTRVSITRTITICRRAFNM